MNSVKLFKCIVVTVGLSGLGCQWPWEPEFGPIIGVVRYPNGAPVYAAKVRVENGAETFTDMLGNYRLPVNAEGDTVTVVARDGYTPGLSYGDISYGSVRFVVRRSVMVKNIVLDRSDPI